MAGRPSKTELGSGVGLSFLDVLCCGLGAVVLLLLLVRHGQQPEVIARPEAAQVRMAQSLRQARTEAEAEERQHQEASLALQASVKQKRQALQAASAQQGGDQGASAQILDAMEARAREEARHTRLQQAFAALDRQRQQAASQPRPQAVSGALAGINLAGMDRVVVLLDVSASMLHEHLVEIIRLQHAGAAAQRQAAKWQQAINAAIWAHSALAPGAQYKILAFSESVQALAGAPLAGASAKWDTKQPGTEQQVEDALWQLSPQGGTNLEQALGAATALFPRPNKLLIITDGLPNQVERKSLAGAGRLQGCKRESFQPGGTTSAECRLSIGIASVNKHGGRLLGVPVDVALLPLHGDAQAVRFYSLVAALSGGRLLTPSPDWLAAK